MQQAIIRNLYNHLELTEPLSTWSHWLKQTNITYIPTAANKNNGD